MRNEKQNSRASRARKMVEGKKEMVQHRLGIVRKACEALVDEGVVPSHSLVSARTAEFGEPIPKKTLERDPYKSFIANYRPNKLKQPSVTEYDRRILALEDEIKYLNEELKRYRVQCSHLRTLLITKGVTYE